MAVPVYYASAADYSVPVLRKAIPEVLDGCLERCGVAGKRILLKPNLLFYRSENDPAAIHPQLIVGIISYLQAHGASEIVLMENPGKQKVPAIIEAMKIGGTLKALHVPYLDFADYRAKELGSECKFRQLTLAREFEEFDLVIDLAKAKTHAMMTLTLAVKNLFGLISSADRLGWHLAVGSDYDRFADLLLDLYLTVRPHISIIDGIVGMESNGPGSGTPAERDFLAASTDALALDASVSAYLGVSRDAMPILRAAEKRGLDTAYTNIGKMEAAKPFRLPDPPGILNAWGVALPPGLKRWLRNLVGSRPQADLTLCIGCGQCVKVCPPQTLKLDSKKHPRFDLNSCIRCYCCQEHCPQSAIKPRQQRLNRFLERAIELFRKYYGKIFSKRS